MSRSRYLSGRLAARRGAVLIAVLLAGWWLVMKPKAPERQWAKLELELVLCSEKWAGADGCVVDGDTIVIRGKGENRRVRLTGFDAPELDGKCIAERNRAIEARDALDRWMALAPFEWDGGADPPRDRYGRELRSARRPLGDGRYEMLEQVMIERGLASPTGRGAKRIDWCR